jgi:adenine deaminase
MRLDSSFIEVARGLTAADTLFTSARIANVFTGEVEKGNVAVYRGRIAGVGDYRLGREIIDLDGKYLLPGYIDGHTHIESSMLDISRYAEAVIPHGTTGVVTDLHEIANVCGIAGIDYILESAHGLPLDLFIMTPSCVPATDLETSGASLDADDIKKLLRRKNVIGLGEMMNFPGVLAGNRDVLAKIEVAGSRMVDGHAPGMRGYDLEAYVGVGISSDHESIHLEEAKEKLARGMYAMIREGSTEKNLEALLPLVNDNTYKRCLFVVDDRSCTDLLNDGDVDAIVRKAIKLGLEPVRAIQLASINAAERFGLKHIGAVAPGYDANLQIVGDIERPSAEIVFYRGKLVAKNGRATFKTPIRALHILGNTFNLKPFGTDRLRLKLKGDQFPIIEVIPGQIITRRLNIMPRLDEAGFIQTDTTSDILKIVVVERHRATGNIGVGMVKGFGLPKGALASSVTHDSHNIVAVGTNDNDIAAAVKEIVRMQGGLAVVSGGIMKAALALPIAGLMSPEPLEKVTQAFANVEIAAKELGCTLPSPFSALSFLALPVIPELRLTDLGLVDVVSFKIIEP